MIRELTGEDVEVVDARLPLNRLDTWRALGTTYLVAWEPEPAGHAHLAWEGTRLGVPELQDVHVLPERRREGIASALTAAAERLAARRGFERLSLSVSVGNEPARRLYERLGYEDAGRPPLRVRGTIVLRGAPLELDDTLVFLVRRLVDFRVPRSS